MIIAYSRVHYGKDYLASVIRSTLPFVDRFVVLYTPVPTFGFSTDLENPDSRDALYDIAVTAAGRKLDWVEGLPVRGETAWRRYPDVELALELDADEVIHERLFTQIIEDYRAGKLTHQAYMLPFMHVWRSFNYGCLHVDPVSGQEELRAWPIRLFLPQLPYETPVPYPNPQERVYHFGYCRSEADMEYKWAISAHSAEIRREWWTDIWAQFPMRLRDLHPVGVNVWHAQVLDRRSLPAAVQGHPYYRLEKVE